MTKIVYRIYKKEDMTKSIATFSEEKHAKQLAKRLNFEVDIKKVLIDDEGKILDV